MKTDATRLYRVTIRNFCAGAITDETDSIIEAAPILVKFCGQQIQNLRQWVLKNGGKIEAVDIESKTGVS